jgi:sodium transport system permease protein
MNNTVFLVLKKELTDMFRDKRTIIMSILIPLLVFPILSLVLGNSINNSTKAVENNIKISIVDHGSSSLAAYLKEQKNVNVIPTSNAEEAVKNGKIYLAVEIGKNFDAEIKNAYSSSAVSIIYDNSSQQSSEAMSAINNLIETFSKQIVAERLKSKNIDTSILNPIKINTETSKKEGTGSLLLSMMLPLLLIMYSVTGPLPAATDLGAGEKERGTLEPLLTTQASRLSLLWGKFLAITVMGVITSISSMIGLFIAMTQSNGMFSSISEAGKASLGIQPKAIIIIGIIAVLTTTVFGALELSISIYARSFKEAQTYLSPLTILAIIPITATYMIDVKNISLVYFNIPLSNEACILKEVISGIYNPVHILLTFGWTAVYIVLCIILARYMFTREKVIFRA